MVYPKTLYDIIQTNYDNIQEYAISLYDKYIINLQENTSIFYNDITKQYLLEVQKYIIDILISHNIDYIEARVFVEDTFIYNNILILINNEE